ncbi:MAG: hypothetical protein SGPRY_013153 [Prymnesium sp.]
MSAQVVRPSPAEVKPPLGVGVGGKVVQGVVSQPYSAVHPEDLSAAPLESVGIVWQTEEGWCWCWRGEDWGRLPLSHLRVLAPLPSLWEEHSCESGTYFVHKASGIAQWHDPRLAPLPLKNPPSSLQAKHPSPPEGGAPATASIAVREKGEDECTVVSSASFTTIASATSDMRRAAAIGSSMRVDLSKTLAAARAGDKAPLPLAALQIVEEENSTSPEMPPSVSPWDSISNTGDPPVWERAASQPSLTPRGIRLQPEGSTEGPAVKIIRPQTFAQLRDIALRKAELLWPRVSGAEIGGIVDAEGCEVCEDNYELVADGALLTVSRSPRNPSQLTSPRAPALPMSAELQPESQPHYPPSRGESRRSLSMPLKFEDIDTDGDGVISREEWLATFGDSSSKDGSSMPVAVPAPGIILPSIPVVESEWESAFGASSSRADSVLPVAVPAQGMMLASVPVAHSTPVTSSDHCYRSEFRSEMGSQQIPLAFKYQYI